MSTTATPVRDTLEGLERDQRHHIARFINLQTPLWSIPGTWSMPGSKGFWNDIITMKWMIHPSASFQLVCLPILLFVNWEIVAPRHDNPFRKIIWITNRLPDSPEGHALYAKSYWDLAFVAYYIVVFSFIRQSLFVYVLQPLARYYGIRQEAKVERFAEQGYAAIYFTCSGALGLWTMYMHLPTWYFRTENFWINYPHWEMAGTLKPFYLLQGAYWYHQFLVLALGVEKPRADFNELVAHHIVTLWLVSWSYLMNMTLFGNAIFLTMDWSDAFLGLSKMFNYLGMEKTKTIAFAWFTYVWTYLRHYLNLCMLWSIWYEWHLIPESSKVWAPEAGAWLPGWVKYAMFASIGILQCINLFWYFLIWRILIRAMSSSSLDDDRSDDEDEDAEPANKKNKSD